MQKKAGKVISIFQGLFWRNLDTDSSISGAHNFRAQIKGLVNYYQWQKVICKLWLLIEMKAYVFIIFLLLIFIPNFIAANIGIFMDSSG